MGKVTNIEKGAGKVSQPFAAVGHSGLTQWHGQIDEEFIRALKYPDGFASYKEMAQNSPIVSACLGTIKQVMRSVEVRVVAAEPNNPEAERQKEFVEECLDDMELTWADTLSEELTMLSFGWCAQEVLYKRRSGRAGSALESSKHKDGLIGWAKMAPRSQDSLDRWIFDENGTVEAMVQLPNYSLGARVQNGATIPAEKLLLFRTEAHKDNPEGRSLLRGAYTSYYTEKNIRFVESVGIERDLCGYPILRTPTEIADTNATGSAATAHAAYKQIGRNIRRDEQECLLLSSERDESGNYIYDIELLSSGGRRQFDTNAIIQRLQKEQALALLCDFVLIGHSNVGSFSLASSKTSIFALAVSGWFKSILAVWNRCAIPRLIRLNGWNEEFCPYLVHGDIESPDLAELGTYISQLASAGFTLGGEELEEQLLAAAGLSAGASEDVG